MHLQHGNHEKYERIIFSSFFAPQKSLVSFRLFLIMGLEASLRKIINLTCTLKSNNTYNYDELKDEHQLQE